MDLLLDAIVTAISLVFLGILGNAAGRTSLCRGLECVAANALDAREHTPDAVVREPQRAVTRRHEPRGQ
jgi:hypothetical protein